MVFFKEERRKEPRNKKVDLFITHTLSEEVLQVLENLLQEEEDVKAQEAALVDIQTFKLESIPLKPGYFRQSSGHILFSSL
jgi:hypothetical protein